ncbi:MAG: FAD-dependent oxidoreductase, partial [bacterium]
AFIYPQSCDYDPAWFATSWDRFVTFAADPATGVVWTRHRSLFEDPAMAAAELALPVLPHASPLGAVEIPLTAEDGAPLTGWEAPGLIADLPRYVGGLIGRLHEAGVTFEERRVGSFDELLASTQSDTIINCTGLGARSLCGDTTLTPLAGELLRVKYDAVFPVERIAGQSYHYHARPERYPYTLYGYPRADRLILGGTRVLCAAGDSAIAEGATYDGLFALNAHVLHGLYGLDLARAAFAYTVGMRPYRTGGPRVEAEVSGDRHVVHCYGHGGAGVSLSWGCAAAAVELAVERY